MKIDMASAFIAALIAAMPNAGNTQEILTHRGAEIEGKLLTSISSKTDHQGDSFRLTIGYASGKSNIPPGSVIEGHISYVERATPGHGARMELSLDDLKIAHAQAIPLRLKITSLAPAGGNVSVASASALTSTNSGDVVVRRGSFLRLQALHDIVLPPPPAAVKPTHDDSSESSPPPKWRPNAYTDELI